MIICNRKVTIGDILFVVVFLCCVLWYSLKGVPKRVARFVSNQHWIVPAVFLWLPIPQPERGLEP
jgi:hypothetical protein